MSVTAHTLQNDLHLRRAVRAAFRLLSITTEGWDEYEAADRHWDGGEWSGSAWADNHEREHDRVTRLVAERFNVTATDLDEAMFIWEMEETRHWVEGGAE
jgi:hypothetical protein